jgi:N-acetylneuraminic acid mutarotase
MKTLLLIFASLCSSFNLTVPPVLVFQDLTPMPTARGAISSATDGKSIYVCNGFTLTQTASGLIEKYDISKNEWSVLTESTIPKQFPSSAIVDDNLYLFNGDVDKKVVNNKVEVINLNSGSISYSANNPQPVHAGGVVTWNKKIYAFGGRTIASPPEYSNKLYEFDPSKKEWKELASMPEKKETKGAVVNGKIYAIGGYNGKPSNKIDVYDIATDKWNELIKMPDGVSGNSVVAYENRIFTFFDYTTETMAGCYDPSTNKFTLLKQQNMVPRRHAGAHIINDKVYIVGGNKNEYQNSCLSSLQVADMK